VDKYLILFALMTVDTYNAGKNGKRPQNM